MNKDVTPERTIYRRVLELRNLRSLRNPGARISNSSKSKLMTPHHHQHLRGKQLENLTRQPGSSQEPKVLRPFGEYPVPFPIV